MTQIRELNRERLKVKIYDTRKEMGNAAADDVHEKIQQLLLNQEMVNIIFAAAPSQNEFLSALSEKKALDWSRVNAFHMDEYIGLNENAPQRFGKFLKEKIFDNVAFHKVFYIDGSATDIPGECRRYAQLLKTYPVDIVCMGIGENGHIAFNEPCDADFNDPQMVKEVTLDDVSRQQQVNDGCFSAIEQVPSTAITLSVPALLRAKEVFCIVPGEKKASAVYHTMNDEVKEIVPSTGLRKHDHAIIYLDRDSAAKL